MVFNNIQNPVKNRIWLPFAILSLAPSYAFSNGYTLLDIGGNFSGPVHSNPASIYWNPAYMGTSQKKLEIMLDASGLYLWVQYKTPSGETVETKGLYPVPFAGITYSYPLRFKTLNYVCAGFAFYVPYGIEGHFPERGPQRYHIVDGSTALFSLSPAISIKLFNIFSLGFAVNIGAGLFSARGSDTTGEFEKPEDEIIYNMKNLSGWGAGVSVGFSISPFPFLDIGASWSSPVSIQHKGKITIKSTSDSRENVINTFGTDFAKGDVDATIDYPWYINAGIKVKPLPHWEFTFIHQFYHWSSFKNIPLHIQNAVDSNGNSVDLNPLDTSRTDLEDEFKTGFKNSLTFRLDVRYSGFKNLLLLGGIGYDESGIPDKYVSVANIEFDKIQVLFAVKYKITNYLLLEAGYNHYIPFKRKIVNSRLQPPADGTYRAEGDRFNLNLTFEL